MALFKKRKFEEIISVCERLEATSNYNADIIAIHSAALIKTRRPEDAVTLLESMLGYFPNDARLHINLAAALKKPSSLVSQEMEIAKKLNPELVTKHNNRRFMLFRLALIVPVLVMVILVTFAGGADNTFIIILGLAITGVFFIAVVFQQIYFLRYPHAIY